MARFFLLALLVTSLLIGGKAEVWLFPFSSFRFLFLASWVLGCVGFPCEQKKDRRVTFGKPTKEEANKSISVDHKMAKFSRVCKVTVVVRGCYAGKKVVIVKPRDEGSKNHSFLHALVAGIERYPLKITGGHDPKKIAMRT